MNCLTIGTIVQRRDVRGDELAVAGRESARKMLLVESEIGQLAKTSIDVGTVDREGYHARFVGGKRDVRHSN
jgi:hypothetical protein